MAYQLEETGDLTRTAAVNIPAQEYDSNVNRALRKLSKRVKVRGFRKGKIPLSVMHQQYGDAVQRDVIEDLVRTSIDKIVEEAKHVLFISQPQVTSIPFKGNGQLEFAVNLELRPQLDPVGYLGVALTKPAIEVTEEELNARVEALRDQYLTFAPIEGREVIEDGDIVTFNFTADEEDASLAEFQGEGAQVALGEGQAMPGIEEALRGAAFDAKVTATVKTDASFQIEELRDREFDINITVTKVEARVRPELNDQFAKDADKGETLEELMTGLREEIASKKEHEAGHIIENHLMDAILKLNTFDLPPMFFEEQLVHAANQQLKQFEQQGMNLKDMQIDLNAFKESMREDRAKKIKHEFLLVAIAEKEELKLNEDDIKAYYEHQALHVGVPVETYARYIAQDQERMRQVSASALLEKTVKHLLAEASVTEGEWPSDDAPLEVEAAEEVVEEAAVEAAEEVVEEAAVEAAEEVVEEAAVEAAEEVVEEAAVEAAGDYDADAAQEAFAALKVSDLKALCKENDLKVGGKKDDLVARLIEAQVAH